MSFFSTVNDFVHKELRQLGMTVWRYIVAITTLPLASLPFMFL